MTDYQQKRKASNEALKEILRPIRVRILVARVLTVVSCGLAIAPYMALTKLGGIFLGDGPIDPDEVWQTVSWLVMVFLTQLALYLLALAITHFADLKMRNLIQSRIVGRIAGAPLSWFSESATGRVRKAIQDDAVQVHQMVAHAPVEQTAAVLTPIVLLIYAFTVDWRLGLLAIGTVPLFVFGQIYMTRGMGEKTAQMDDKLADISARAVELADGIHVVKNFGQTGKAHARYSEACHDFARFYWDWCGPLLRISALSLAVIAAAPVMALNLGIGLAMANAGWVTMPQVLTCSLIALMIPRSIEVITNSTWAYQQAGHAALRLRQIVTTPQLEHAVHPVELPSDLTVTFDDVSFSYHDDPAALPALAGVNLTLEPGTVTALVGPSGSGKSTLATMLARFRDPAGGRITVGGVDLRDIAEEDIYRLVGFVLQQPYLQRRSIRDNVALARPDATMDELRQAARQARILDEIEALPRGWDTVVGEETDLSGGQKQRLSIARAIVADAPILVLDEATTATDTDSEAQIQAALSQLAHNRTVLVIAHHAESVRGADQICVMEAGRIVASGSPADLSDHPYWQQLRERSLV